MKLGLIGNGAIARVVAGHCAAHSDRFEIAAALGLETDVESVGAYPLVHDLPSLMSHHPDLVIECASQAAVAAHCAAILKSGCDVMIISVGAFAADELRQGLERAAHQGGAKIYIPPGALAGLNAISAARTDGLDEVTLRTRKPPKAWSGAPGVEGVDLDAITEPTVIFSGTAREAAQAFPKNANVAAAVALAGIGMDQTRVELIADPAASRNNHLITAHGPFGRLKIDVEAEPSPHNPKTSHLAALSIVRALDRLTEVLVL
jgi:aspartate dehydrogenase